MERVSCSEDEGFETGSEGGCVCLVGELLSLGAEGLKAARGAEADEGQRWMEEEDLSEGAVMWRRSER